MDAITTITPDLIARLPATLTPRCHATAKTTGSQCAKTAIPGGTVCYYHGGAAPQVRRKAAENVAHLVEGAQERLWDHLSGPNGDMLDPNTLWKIIKEGITTVELLEGRATSRSEEHTLAEKLELTIDVRGRLEQLARGMEALEVRNEEDGIEG